MTNLPYPLFSYRNFYHWARDPKSWSGRYPAGVAEEWYARLDWYLRRIRRLSNRVTIRAEFADRSDGLDKWCDENSTAEWTCLTTDQTDHIYYFASDHDAVHFRLRFS